MSNNTTSGSIHPLAEHYETFWSWCAKSVIIHHPSRHATPRHSTSRHVTPQNVTSRDFRVQTDSKFEDTSYTRNGKLVRQTWTKIFYFFIFLWNVKVHRSLEPLQQEKWIGEEGGGGGWCRDGGSVSTENIFLNQVHEQPLSRLTVVLRVTVAVTLKTTVNLLAAWFYNMWHYIPVLIMGHATEVRTDANHLCLVPSGSKLPFFFFFFFVRVVVGGGCVCFCVCVWGVCFFCVFFFVCVFFFGGGGGGG